MEKKCRQCGYKWTARKKHPKECPECKSRKWHKKKEEKK